MSLLNLQKQKILQRFGCILTVALHSIVDKEEVWLELRSAATNLVRIGQCVRIIALVCPGLPARFRSVEFVIPQPGVNFLFAQCPKAESCTGRCLILDLLELYLLKLMQERLNL